MKKGSPLVRIEKQPAATDGEKEVLRLLASGRTAKEIAALMYVSERTVKNWLAAFRDRHQLKNTVQAVAYATRKRII
jgi:NarL family two-component system response regulator LiaR